MTIKICTNLRFFSPIQVSMGLFSSKTKLTEEDEKIRKEKIMYIYNHRDVPNIVRQETSEWLKKYDQDLIFLAFKAEVLNFGTKEERLESNRIRDLIVSQKPQDDDERAAQFSMYTLLGNPQKSFEVAEEGAKNNHPLCLCHVGWCYMNGKGCTKDLEKGKSFYKLSIDHKGPALAYYNLGLQLESEGDKEGALKLYLGASSFGYSFAVNKLSMLYKNDIESKESFLFHSTVFNGKGSSTDSKILYNLGCFYFYGNVVQKDYDKAVEIWEMGNSKELTEVLQYMEDNEFE